MRNKLSFLSICLLFVPITYAEMSSKNITCALCLVGVAEVEAMADYGLDDEMLLGVLIEVRNSHL